MLEIGSIYLLPMQSPSPIWPYLPTLARLALALALGLFVGLERERRGKEAGLRTFAFTAVLGAVGGLLGEHFALMALALLGVLVVLLNIETLRTGEGAEITTSAALFVVGFMGILAGQGHTFIPTAIGVATAALLAWKEPLAGFTRGLTSDELRSAILLAILAFVIYPVLPEGNVDPWSLVAPRSAWVTIILIAALGFCNYVLLKLYGARGIVFTGFVGGLVNSTVTVTELAERVRTADGRYSAVAYRGTMLATAAMLVRNAILLGLIAPAALLAASIPHVLMILGAVGATLGRSTGEAATRATPDGAHEGADDPHRGDVARAEPPMSGLASPFSLRVVLTYGAIFLAIQVTGTVAQRALGDAGFFTISAIGGLVSSASAVAAAANLAAAGTLPVGIAATGAVIASMTSALVNLPLVARVGRDRLLTRRIAVALGGVVILGGLGTLVQAFLGWGH